MEITLKGEEVAQLTGAAEAILRIIGYAQGREDSYVARREECRLITFPSIEKSPAESGTNYLPKGIEHDSETDCRSETPFYSPQEVKRLPKLKDGKYRKTKDGLHQIRYRREGYDKQFTSKDLKTVKEEFREWIKSINEERKTVLPKKAQNFFEFAERYFENIKQTNVDAGTYKEQHRSAELHIYPQFGELSLRQITPLKCQELLKGILDAGKGRTAETIKYLLGEILRAAAGERLISESPMKFVKIPKHIRKNGVLIPRGPLHAFIEACEKSPYRKQFMTYLYTGIRRNEIHSLRIEGDFISVVCGKARKGQPKRRRKIPIAPALRPFLPLSEAELAVKNDVFTNRFGKMCKGYTLNDLRHTFTTRAQECGISKALVDLWTDHIDKKDMTAGVYTHFSPEFQLEEIKKLVY